MMWVALLGTVIGLVLAFTGAGGGILSVPLLVFGLHLSVQQAAPIGMLAVFAAASLGAVLAWREALVRYRAAALMGAAGMVMAPFGVFLAQHIPNRPLIVAFSAVLLYSAWRSLAAPATTQARAPCVLSSVDQRLIWTRPCAQVLAGTGLLSGLLSGLLGVGGGFVIVPALSRYTNLSIRSVHATSLAVMALVSLSGVVSATAHGAMNWAIALPFAAGAIVALLAGRRLASRVHPTRLQQVFAWFCVGVAVLMLARAGGLLPV
ncbi:sulfite exporter TauE/SafE family protein [Rhodoferax sp. U11-2br]|uniref:sulfite exporter TauE/SafE family protein n=1 Tax=Rhodoferax sp. U11-2br TaxID=2838878 RepID=UPI001BECE202|nr:sulfite exporter TauE/SafE family protein [Rhodoferax sp. U11-2br]MBT3066211.1 sulfite exporter TauE/SafE family protein [Rhodoferax sp. U11-2br]